MMSDPIQSDRTLPLIALPAGRLLDRTTTLAVVMLVSITALGLVLRLYSLTGHGVWFDEAYHVQLVQLPTIASMLDAVLSNPPSAPLYVLLLRAWTTLFGYSDASVRMLSVLFGTATVPATYWLGRAFVGRVVGMAGALLVAVSPYVIEFSQEAALYALASLTTTLALAAGWRWRGSTKGYLLYIIVGIFAIYSHYVVAAILVLFSLLGLYILREEPGANRRNWLLANAAIFLAWVPWLTGIILYWSASLQPRAMLSHTATAEELLGALLQFSSGSSSQQGGRLLQLLGLSSGAVLLAAGWYAGTRQKAPGLQLVPVMSGLIFIPPALISAMTGRWLFVPHFMVFLLPAIFVVIAAGAARLWDANKDGGPGHAGWRYLSMGLMVAWLVAQVWGLTLYYRYPPHGTDGLRELTSVLSASAGPGDKVFVTPPVLTPTLRQYYEGNLRGLPVNFDLREVYLPYDPDVWTARSISIIEQEAAGRDRLWLIYRPERDAGGRLLDYFMRRYKPTERHDYSYASLFLFERQ